MRRVKRVVLLAVCILCMLYGAAFAAYVMPIESGDMSIIRNDIVAVMAKEYPNAIITEQTPNLISFREHKQAFLIEAYRFFDFHIYPNVNEQGGMGTKVTLHVRHSAGTDLNEVEDWNEYDNVLIAVKALSDGYYYYGFDFEKNKISNVHPKSNSYAAGLRDGDRIVSINGYKIVNNTMLGRIMACPRVTFKTKSGKVVTVEGHYSPPEQVRGHYFRQ